MKTLLTLLTALCLASPVMAKEKEKEKPAKKEVARQMYTATVEGGTEEDAPRELQTAFNGIKGVKVESVEKSDKGHEVTLSTDAKTRLSRGDLSKALKEKKQYKVAEFRAKRPEKEGKDSKDSKDGKEK